jgi:hypothetical protein
MSVTITAQEITRANNPQPLGQTESGIVRANVYNDVVTDLENLATAVNKTEPVITTVTANTTLPSTGYDNTVILNVATGAAISLPTPVVGVKYNIVVKTSVTSNTYTITTNLSAVKIVGSILSVKTTTGPTVFTSANDVSIVLNGTTTGGLQGTTFSLTCISDTQWLVEGIIVGSGTLATPFATL